MKNHMFTCCCRLLEYLRKHDEESYLHSVRVADIAGRIAEGYGLDASAMPDLRVAGLLHDIGKLGVPSEILQKPGRLTDVEYMTVKRHTTLGYVILQKFDFPEHICEVALNHHERPDGTGYAKKTDLSVFSRIICAADCMDVMMHGRSYAAAKSTSEIRADFLANSARQFDPAVADACIRILVRG